MTFTPFDDTQQRVREPELTKAGYDTSVWDAYRQGVEITTDRLRFISTQPKLWAGRTDGVIELVTYGQSLSSIDGNATGLESKFKDLPIFNPVAFITQGDSYPYPLIFNEGATQQEEAILEPLTIPFRRPTNEGPYYAHSVRASMEDGNDFDSFITKGSSRIQQFIDIQAPLAIRPFLDQGGDLIGNVKTDAYISSVERIAAPFDDTQSQHLSNKVPDSNPEIKNILLSNIVEDEESLIPFGQKSATAGYSYTITTNSRYGTDSIAFGGWARS